MKFSQEKKKIHFIGIGGIGVSALAKYYLLRGFDVSGSDLVESGILKELRKSGAGVFIRHRRENVNRTNRTDKTDINLVVYSAAVEKNNPELLWARRQKIKCQTYAQALGDVTKKYFTIAVSGTHGKSTTTAMIALILVEAGLDPTVIVGTKVGWGNKKKISPSPSFTKRGEELSNFRAGKSKYLVIEADEYAESFLNYWPKIIVLTNIEEDHLDYYKNLGNILKAFGEYVGHLDDTGLLIVNSDDANIEQIIQKSKCKNQNYSSKLKIKGLSLRVPGRHNLMDAYAAISAARALKIPDAISIRALNKFTGTWRRFEYKGKVNGASVYDDYGHHPTEIKATLRGAREFLNKSSKLWVVFQPHQYQRTHQLFDQFVGALNEADKIILLPIYSVAGREDKNIKKKVSSEKLAEAIRFKNKEILYIESFDKAVNYLRKNLSKGDIAVIMGAGDIYLLTQKLKIKN